MTPTQPPPRHRARARRAAALALLATLLGAASASPCGPYAPSVRFWREPWRAYHPDAGRGIVVPGTGVRDLVAAWRLWNGSGLTPELEAALGQPVETPPRESGDNGLSDWLAARAAYGAVADPDPWSPVDMRPDASSWQVFLNCPEDAWTTAASTLRDRESRYGAGSERVRRWVAAQDLVFAACSGSAPLPEPPERSWSAAERADRSYQIAAARLYNRDYEGAIRDFSAIAGDPGSPWRPLARYLVGRTWIRRWSVAGCPAAECLVEAVRVLRAAAAEAAEPRVRDAARNSLALALARLAPLERRAQLAGFLVAERHAGGEPPAMPPLATAVTDYEWLLHRTPPYLEWQGEQAPAELRAELVAAPGAEATEADEWIALLHHPVDGVEAMAAQRWRERRTLPWLAAALALRTASGDSGHDLLAAAAEVPASSPAALTVGFHRARWLAGIGEADTARAILDELLAREVPAADRGRVVDLRAAVSSSLDDLLPHAVLTPYEVGIEVEPGPLWQGYEPRPPEPWLVPSALALIEHALPLARWDAVAADPRLPATVREHVALTGWARAVALADDDAGDALAARAAALAPEVAADLQAWRDASTAGDRRFAAALAMLRRPGVRPILRPAPAREEPLGEIDSLRDNWWCAAAQPSGMSSRAGDPPPVAWPAGDRAQAAGEGERLAALASAPEWLGEAVLDRARSHPADPRLPEALHLVVRSTRYGCPDRPHGETSRAAFELLHRRYASSPWTARTPYWFD